MSLAIQEYEADFETGVCTGMPNAVYHSNTEAISLSKLKLFLESPEIYYGTYITGETPRKETDALRCGSAQHVFSLEGCEAFEREFAVLPELKWRSKADKAETIPLLNSALDEPLADSALEPLYLANKEEILAFFTDFPGRTHLVDNEMEVIKRVDAAIKEHPLAGPLLDAGVPEVTFRSGVSKELGFAVQCRADWINPVGCESSGGQPYLLDLKTVANLDRWERNFLDCGYWLQWPYYCNVMQAVCGERPAKLMFFVVAETQWPWRVRVRVPDSQDWQPALQEIERGFRGISYARKNNAWQEPGADLAQVQSLPAWKRTQLEIGGAAERLTPGELETLALE